MKIVENIANPREICSSVSEMGTNWRLNPYKKIKLFLSHTRDIF